ncbi:MAG: gephyrin-like molybdotransferase Glp [Pseudomonadota bacterium]
MTIEQPPLRNDCFAMPPGVDWTPVDVALETLRAGLSPVVGVETVALDAAMGRVLAEDVVARRSHPPAANSAVDGYGMALGSLGQPPHTLPLVEGRSAAGEAYEGYVPAGHAIRILTGALIPKGVDAVVLEEDCAITDTHISFSAGLKPGANVRPAGEDIGKGDEVARPGRVLSVGDVATFASVGVNAVALRKPLHVGVLSTGDELVEPGSTDNPARTYDANRPMLLSLIRAWGYVPVDLGHVADDRNDLRARLDGARVDAILTSGGASAGDEDHVSALLGEVGTRSVWRIAMKPGRPLALGLWNGVPVFGLPGNPVAAFVCSLIFARPSLSVLAGAAWVAPRAYTLPAAFRKRKKPGRREYLRARLTQDGAVEVFPSEGSGRVSGLAWADGLVELPDEAVDINPGDPVRYLPFRDFGL